MVYYHGIRLSMEDKNYFIYNGGFVTTYGNYNWDSSIMENLGTTLDDFKEGKYVLLKEEQIAFFKSHIGATPVEVWNMTMSSEASSKDIAILIRAIKDYGDSEAVKTFYINNTPIWYDSETRASINSSVTIEKNIGKETTTLWVNNTPYELATDVVLDLLTQVEVYSKSCYNNTQSNIKEALSLTLKKEVESFDITKGYPEKLNFNLQ